MAHQYEKFLKVARTLSWRGNVASMNYLLSSVLWRQEHNGFTHQNPSFISSMLEKHDCNISVYFPADDNSMLAVLDEVFTSKNGINLVVAGKTVEPRWQTVQGAKKELKEGLSIWNFASDENPDIILCGIGDYMTKEAMAALEMIKVSAPEIKVRFVNVMKLHGRCQCKDATHPQIPSVEKYFGENIPVILNYHGYPETIEAMLLHVKNPERFFIHGYQELGGTTTPMDMHMRNETSRYHLAIDALEKMKTAGKIDSSKAEKIIVHFRQTIAKHFSYITTYGTDPIELEDWHWDSVDNTKDDAIQLNVLQKTKVIAIVGLSENPDRYSYKVAQYLQEQGFTIVPINPHVEEVLGEKAYSDLLSVPQDKKIDLVTIYRRSEEVFPHVQEVITRGDAKMIWLPEGVRNKEAEEYAKNHGVTMVSDFCIMKVHQRMQDKIEKVN
ncbi:MAG: CoA-binding protein, partial [Candidatus Levyibacteriota bacterium]